MQSSDKKRTSRRDFLKVAGATTAGLMAGGLAKSEAYAIAAPRVIGANDRIGIGHIGCGGQGQAHIRFMREHATGNNTQSIAICEIYERRKNEAKSSAGLSDSGVVADYRKILENKDVDVVVIATPEHWHFKQAMDALQAGKDIYLEKPMTRHVQEALDLYKAVKNSDRIVQVGSQITSDPKWHRARDLVKEGKIGKVVWSQDSYCRNAKGGEWNYEIHSDANPMTVDWDTWLGSAPKRPWSPERYFRWRKYWDYATGITGDLLPHRAHPLMLVLGAEWPARVTCTGGQYVQKDRDVPDTVMVTVDYPSGHTMLLAGCTCNDVGLVPMVRGNKATMYLSGKDVEIKPQAEYGDEVDEIRETVGSGQEDIAAHHKNFFECVRSRKAPNCSIDLAAPVMVAIGLAEPAYRQSKTMLFDPVKLQVTNP